MVWRTLYRGQTEDKASEDEGHREMYNASHQRLYCETAQCDCSAATSSDVPAYIAPSDVTSYRTCYAPRRPEVGGRAEHAHEPGTVLTLHCVEDVDGGGQCECYHIVDARSVDSSNYCNDAERIDATQLDLLRHDMASSAASVI